MREMGKPFAGTSAAMAQRGVSWASTSYSYIASRVGSAWGISDATTNTLSNSLWEESTCCNKSSPGREYMPNILLITCLMEKNSEVEYLGLASQAATHSTRQQAIVTNAPQPTPPMAVGPTSLPRRQSSPGACRRPGDIPAVEADNSSFQAHEDTGGGPLDGPSRATCAF